MLLYFYKNLPFYRCVLKRKNVSITHSFVWFFDLATCVVAILKPENTKSTLESNQINLATLPPLHMYKEGADTEPLQRYHSVSSRNRHVSSARENLAILDLDQARY